MSLSFKEAFGREQKKNLDNPAVYPILCKVLQESGASKQECKKIFLDYMPKDEYDSHEVEEMSGYLFWLAQQ